MWAKALHAITSVAPAFRPGKKISPYWALAKISMLIGQCELPFL